VTQNADTGTVINREYIDRFIEEHGHAPWILCSDPDYGCLLKASPHDRSGIRHELEQP
jgi:hypothetical protein